MRRLLHAGALAAGLLGLAACAGFQPLVTPGPGEPPVIVQPTIPEGMVRLPFSGDIVAPAEACRRYAEFRDAAVASYAALTGSERTDRINALLAPWRSLLRQIVCDEAPTGPPPPASPPPE